MALNIVAFRTHERCVIDCGYVGARWIWTVRHLRPDGSSKQIFEGPDRLDAYAAARSVGIRLDDRSARLPSREEFDVRKAALIRSLGVVS